MRWPVIKGKKRAQPSTGNWQDWKQTVADHCEGRCIYCAIHESRFGGVRNFHIEHFRPKIKFPALENSIKNLYLACSICNVLKCDDWPAAPRKDHSIAAYPDPHICDYNGIFSLTTGSYEIAAASVAGQYLIERLLLNRGQLTLERRLSKLLDQMTDFQDWITGSLKAMTPKEKDSAVLLLIAISTAQKQALTKARPYLDQATKRPKDSKAQKRRRK